MSHRSLALLTSIALLACTSEPTTAAGTEIYDWSNEGHLSVSGITQTDSVGEDLEQRWRFSYSPTALTGIFDPTLEDLRLEITITTGVRTMRREDGTAFTAHMPLSMRATTLSESHWVITPSCDDAIASPMPGVGPGGVLAYADGATFWETCTLELTRGENLQYLAHLEVWGNGRVEGSAGSGAVTVTNLR